MHNHGGARPGAGRKPGPRTDDQARLVKAKADRESAMARIRNLEADEREGKLIPADEVLHAWQGIALNIRQRFLALPSKMAGICAHRPAREIEEALRIEVRHILTELADTGRGTDL